MQVYLERPSLRREAEFIRAVRRSRSLHRGFVTAPTAPAAYRNYLAVLRRRDQEAFFVILAESQALAGVVTIDDIARGSFQSANLGYYSLVPHAGKGYMRQGVELALEHCFRELRLHRLEANVQPANERSIALVASIGFRKEGLAIGFAKVAGRWRDHERWAMLASEWRARRRRDRGEHARVERHREVRGRDRLERAPDRSAPGTTGRARGRRVVRELDCPDRGTPFLAIPGRN